MRLYAMRVLGGRRGGRVLRAVSNSLCARWQVAEALREREVARKKAEAEKAALKQAEAEAAARKRAEAVGAPVCS